MRYRNRRTAPKLKPLPLRQVMAAAAYDPAEMAVEDMNMLQRLRFTSDFFFAQAEREMKKTGRVDSRLVFELMQAGATIAWRLAPFVHPKIVAVALDLTKLEKRGQVDLGKLSDDELDTLEGIMRKAAVVDPDDVEEPTDEYLPDR